MSIGCVAGFAALLILPRLLPGAPGAWTGAILFVALALVALAWATAGRWTILFPQPSARDLLVGLAFAPITLGVSALVAFPMMKGGLTSANAAVEHIHSLSALQLAGFLPMTAVQLMGEELVTILPFLVLLSAGVSRLGRWPAILCASVATSLIFGALHLPTYQWHVGQSLLVIGAARMALTASYLVTRNIWTSFVAHLANDWSLFAVALLIHR